MEHLLSEACEQARTRASLALDCELSELEAAHLRAHLAVCEGCSGFVGGLREVTHELRAAPLPAPSRPLELRAYRGRRVPLVLAALVVVAAAAAGGVAGALRPAPAQTSPAAIQVVPQDRPGTRLPQQRAV